MGGRSDHNDDAGRVGLTALRKRLESTRGREYWRSLEELADTSEFREFVHREFPKGASEWLDSMDRRRFLKLMGASFALAGLTGCRALQPEEKIVPFVRAQPYDVVPGVPLFFATAMELGGTAIGLLIKSYEGRPIKAEGNPNHPGSLGGTDLFSQGSLLTMYDPDRAQVVRHRGEEVEYDEFLQNLLPLIDGLRARKGEGLRVLTETVTSPTLGAQLETLLGQFPKARWHQYEPVGRDNELLGARLAFGRYVHTVYDLGRADVVLSLDSDFLSALPENVRYIHDFAGRRKVTTERPEMNRLYAIESTPTNTGAKADNRLAMRASEVEGFARVLAGRLGLRVRAPELRGKAAAWLDPLVSDLQGHRGSSVVIPGRGQPPAVHALAHAINQALGNVGRTVFHTAPLEVRPVDQTASLRELVRDMNAGRVGLLLVLGGNPVYTAPADLDFAGALQKVGTSVQLSLYEDETSKLTDWHIPENYYLEDWSDTRGYDGTISVVQPLIVPLYASRSAHELLNAFIGDPYREGREIVRGYWRGRHPSADFESWWERTLNRGIVEDSALPAEHVSLRPGWESDLGDYRAPPQDEMEIVFRPDPSIFDGRFANNGWLQELPKPLTKLTWDNAVLLSSRTAERLGVRNEDVVELGYRGRTVREAVWIAPGHADDSATVYLGYGRTLEGRVAEGTGFNAYLLRTSDAPWFGTGLRITKTPDTYPLVSTQSHFLLEGTDVDGMRAIVRSASLDEYRRNPAFAHEEVETTPPNDTLYPEYDYSKSDYSWGMAVDLDACVGCNACVIACEVENNSPVVGKGQVANAREMHWLRIDTYFKGSLEEPEAHFQPMFCQHCEKAPCEVVCPVYATVHSEDGLNDMIYNRCVGTRFCSNNCPYKVRRFNFLQYADKQTLSYKLGRNPDVTVRERGVMEKCTYCVQRIREAQINAENENRKVRDGEVQTACQAACPANVFTFGNMNDRDGAVFGLKQDPRNYSVLGQLDTQPHTTYLAEVRNPNPRMEESE